MYAAVVKPLQKTQKQLDSSAHVGDKILQISGTIDDEKSRVYWGRNCHFWLKISRMNEINPK